MRESGLHQLYMVANSLQCVKASGDRGPGSGMSSGSRMNSTVGSGSGSNSGSGSGSGSNNNNNSSTNTNNNNTHEITKETVDPEPIVGICRPSLVSFSKSELESVRQIALCDGTEGPLGQLVASLCPTIFGHELVKLGLILGK